MAVGDTSAQLSLRKRAFDRRNPEQIRKALTKPGLNAAAQGARFGEAFGSNLNSPIVDGTATTNGAYHELNLAGLVLHLRDARGGLYALQVAGSGTTTYWAGAPDLVPTYTLTYTSAAQPAPQALCTAGVTKPFCSPATATTLPTRP